MQRRACRLIIVVFLLFAFSSAQALTISGRIIWTDNNSVGVKGVTVNLSGADTQSTTTNDRGIYSFITSSTGDFTLTPSYSASVVNGVNATDAALVQDHVTGASLLADSYKLIAADVNNSTTVSASDVSTITQAFGGNPVHLNIMTTTGSWKFVPTSYVSFPYPPTSPNNISGYPTTISLTGVASDSTLNNFIGVKIGDVNGTADTGPATIDSATTSKASGTYGVGEVVPITINFSELVTSTGSVTVTIETGSTDRTCTFTITSATGASCNYTVQSGDNVSDLYVSSVSGVINDISSNPVADFIVYTNISDAKDINIDTTLPVVSEVTAVSSFTNDTTPSYSFSTTKAGTIYYGGACASATTSATVGTNTIVLNALAQGTYSNCTVTVTDAYANTSVALSLPEFVVDTLSPVVSENTPVVTPSNDETPNYAFTSDEIGTVSYGGGCLSSNTAVVSGVNYITFNTLNPGTYANCTITINDRAGNVSNTISVSSFTINANGAVAVSFIQQPQSNSNISSPTQSSILTQGYDCKTGDVFSVTTGKPCNLDETLPGVYCKYLPGSPHILEINSVHNSVKILQEILNGRGYIVSLVGLGSKGNEINTYGSKTKKAVIKFQKEKNIRVDGIVGPETRTTLNSYCGSLN